MARRGAAAASGLYGALAPLKVLAALACLAAFAPASAGAGGLLRRAAAPDPAATCIAEADRAADKNGVPRAVMRAITRTETGRAVDGALQPWPWTVNMEGVGRWFDDLDAALAYVAREQARGATSFDVGCFQLNHRWHGQAFASVRAMFDPAANADYAARFLVENHAETGDWTLAAGLYHSRTPEFRDRYAARFAHILARGEGAAGPVDTARAEAPGERAGRRAPSLWRAADPPPRTAGGVALVALRGGLSPLRAARGGLIN
ncbi:hypothetical protein [Rubrimonas cliftonensis]|uniref:Transglycosylase SLT domain-containing protein n=1 Tax=Rubrimonas cliftonensis TaxID=89524 RepID=A0A1H4F2Q4_9RHOB|nr:hypothetical protein [Rubrimonas cliftonensis]SEA91595.1 hypothetical protein SAMN05444370_1187 [Rubrimonas cliftonensis]